MALMYLSMTRWPIKPNKTEQEDQVTAFFNQIRNPVIANANRRALLKTALYPIS